MPSSQLLIVQNAMNPPVTYQTQDREWDARINVPTEEYQNIILANLKHQWERGTLKYALMANVEVGTAPLAPDYLVRHVHLALIYNNRVTKSSIVKNLGIIGGNGYYLVPRNRKYPYSGWRDHHIKTDTKETPDQPILFEAGDLPGDKPGTEALFTKRSDDEKKRKLDEIIIDMKKMLDAGEDEEEIFKKFPRNWLTYGARIKAMTIQQRDFFKSNGDPHVWLMGTPGTGKSAVLQLIYPKYYNKNLDTRFFDLYTPGFHTHLLLQDVDHGVVEKLGVQFFKAICDEAGYPLDQKYKAPQITRFCVLCTSNYSIDQVIPEDFQGRNDAMIALHRRYWVVNIKDLLPRLGLKLLSKYEINQLKKAGNTDPSKIFIAWDYLRDCPTGKPLKTPEEYQQIMRDLYYGN